MSTILKLYLDVVVFCFGAVVGSFLNVCIHRMPRGESIVSPPSHCPHCQQPIRWYDNIPLISYLVLRGRCRTCGTGYTCRYFLVELLTAVLFLGIWLTVTAWQAPDPARAHLGVAAAWWVLVAGLVAGSFIDFEHFIIPNEITYGGVVVGFVFSALYPPLMGATTHAASIGRSLLGIVVGGVSLFAVTELGKLVFGRLKVPLPAGTTVRLADQHLRFLDEEHPWEEIFYRDSDRIRFEAAKLRFQERSFENVAVTVSETELTVAGEKFALADIGPVEAETELLIVPREAMGLGDVKFLAGIGAFLGWQASLFTVFFSSVLGGVVGVILMATGKKDLQSRIPFGPYIAAGALLWMFAGQPILDWYWNLMAVPMG